MSETRFFKDFPSFASKLLWKAYGSGLIRTRVRLTCSVSGAYARTTYALLVGTT